MTVDTELAAWRDEWQSSVAIPFDLKSKVERQSRFMRIMLICDIVVTITIGGATAGWAIRSGRANVALLAMETWIAIAVAWAFAITVNRGKWSPSAEDAAVFTDLAVRRCRARLAAVSFAVPFFVLHAAFVVSWVYRFTPGRRMPLSRWLVSIPLDAVWLGTAAFFGFAIWYRRRKRAELAWFLRLRDQMHAGVL